MTIYEIIEKYSIDTYGIINTVDFDYLSPLFHRKKELGLLSDFSQSDFSKLRSSSILLPNTKSIISIAFPYDTGEPFPEINYNISKYAVRNDYHIVVKSILEAIVSDLKKLYPHQDFIIQTDSNFLFEKEIAVLAGIGFIGKNNLLYTKKYGSFVFLGEIITDLFIPSKTNNSFKSNCENCGICKSVCPNSCISEDLYNPINCISYLNQKKGDISNKNIEDYLWGCDICQNNCPMNSARCFSKIKEFALIKDIFIPLEKISSMSNREIKLLYKNTPIGWSGASVVRRNSEKLLLHKLFPHIPN